MKGLNFIQIIILIVLFGCSSFKNLGDDVKDELRKNIFPDIYPLDITNNHETLSNFTVNGSFNSPAGVEKIVIFVVSKEYSNVTNQYLATVDLTNKTFRANITLTNFGYFSIHAGIKTPRKAVDFTDPVNILVYDYPTVRIYQPVILNNYISTSKSDELFRGFAYIYNPFDITNIILIISNTKGSDIRPVVNFFKITSDQSNKVKYYFEMQLQLSYIAANKNSLKFIAMSDIGKNFTNEIIYNFEAGIEFLYEEDMVPERSLTVTNVYSTNIEFTGKIKTNNFVVSNLAIYVSNLTDNQKFTNVFVSQFIKDDEKVFIYKKVIDLLPNKVWLYWLSVNNNSVLSEPILFETKDAPVIQLTDISTNQHGRDETITNTNFYLTGKITSPGGTVEEFFIVISNIYVGYKDGFDPNGNPIIIQYTNYYVKTNTIPKGSYGNNANVVNTWTYNYSFDLSNPLSGGFIPEGTNYFNFYAKNSLGISSPLLATWYKVNIDCLPPQVIIRNSTTTTKIDANWFDYNRLTNVMILTNYANNYSGMQPYNNNNYISSTNNKTNINIQNLSPALDPNCYVILRVVDEFGHVGLSLPFKLQ